MTKYKCGLCYRDKFDKPYTPHNCVDGFRKGHWGNWYVISDEWVNLRCNHQTIYSDAMERAIKAVREKATYTDKKGNKYEASLGALECEIAIRQELEKDAGGDND